MASSRDASETSPLFRGPSNEQYGSVASAQPSGDNDPNIESATTTGEGVRDVEGQPQSRNYDGVPEVRKQLKYILPALAIGVRYVHSLFPCLG